MRRGTYPALWPYCCLAIFLWGLAISAVTPPFHAPDEYAHVARAMMLGEGQILLDSKDGTVLSGGYVDSGIVQYAESFPNKKIQRADTQRAEAVQWTGRDAWVTPSGTGYYFPLLYTPQAAAFKLGQTLGLTVHRSYLLARTLALLCSVALLALAFRLYPPPAGALALLLLPMYLFLGASAVLDPMATAASLLAVACYMRLSEGNTSRYRLTCVLLLASVVAVTSCRANMLPMLLLPFAAYGVTKDRKLLIGSVLASALVLAWTYLVIRTTKFSGNGVPDIGSGSRLVDYLLQPDLTIRILWTTITDPDLRTFYARSFIGVLGWLDVPLPDWFYPLAWSALGLVLLSTLPLRAIRWTHFLLILVGLASLVLTFLALLIQWTPDQATKIDGIQGRYFLLPMMLVTYALTASRKPFAKVSYLACASAIGVLASLGGFLSVQAILTKYHSQSAEDLLQATRPQASEMRLVGNGTMQVDLVGPFEKSAMKRIGIMFDTAGTQRHGKLTISLQDAGGTTVSTAVVDLAAIKDGSYTFFDVQGGPFSRLVMQGADGSGLGVYEATIGPVRLSCARGVTLDGRAVSTPGCP